MKTKIRVGDLVTWSHKGKEYVARVDSMDQFARWFSNSNLVFVYQRDYDAETVFVIHDRESGNDA